MERRHSTTSDSSDSSHTKQSSGDNIESLVGRVSKVTAPKPPANALQFVKTRPCELYRSAQEQLKKVEELKKAKKLVPDEAEEWQSNLDNWKCSRRKRQEHIIERVVEVKKLELEEHERNRRRSKTFNEMLQERNSRGRKTSLPVYQDDSNDLSYLGIGNGDRSISHDSCSTTTDSDHERDISFDQNSEKRFEGDNAIVQNGQNEKTEANDAGNNSEDVEEYTYERAIQSYVNFTESRVKGRAARSSSVEQKNFINGQTNECPPIPLKPRRSSNPRIGNSISQIEQRKHSASTADLSETLRKQPDVPKVDISKRKELFEKSTDADEMGKKMNRATEFSSSKSIKERLSSLKEYTGVNKVQSTNRLPTEISVKDRLSDIEKMKEKEDINQLKRRSSEQLSTQSIKEMLSNLEKVKNSSLKLQQQNTVEPTITLKERLSSLQSACTKDPNVMLPNTEQHLNEKPILNERPQGQVEECYQMNQTDKYERAFSPDDLYSNKAQQHYRHRSLDSLDIDNDGASNDTFGRVQSLEDLDYCRNYPASSLSGDTDREDSGIHTADVSSCVSQADDYDLHMDSNSDDIKLHHQPTILEENKVAQYENSLTSQDSSCAFSFSESNDSRNVSPQAFGSSLDNAEEHGVLDEFSNSNKVSLKHGSPLPQSLPIILENSEAFPNPLNLVDGLSDSKKRLCADYSSSQNISMDGDVINHDEVFSKKNKSVCNVEKPSSNFTSGHAPLPQGGTNISDCSIVNLSHVESNEQRIEDVEMGKRKMDSSNTVSSSSSKNPADEPNMYNSQQKPDRKTNEYGDKDNGTITEVIQNIYSVDGVELDDNVQPIDLKDPKSLNENNDHIESFKTQMDTTNVNLLSTHDKFGNYSFEPRHNHSEPDVFMPTQSFQGGLFLNLNIDQEVESVFQLSPAALEPPKEKPPPPPTDFSDDEVDITSSKKPSSLRRLDSTKRIKKEIRQKRSSFLGIEGNMDDNYMDPELELIRPPDMTTLLAEERRMERRLYRQSVCSESDSNQESRDSGVELDNKSQDIACWNHSRNDSEVYCNQSTTSEEDEIMRKEREIIETLEQEERIRKQDLGEKLALRLRQLEVEKGRGDWDRANPNDFRNKSEKLNQDSNNIQDIDEFKINGNEPNHLESLNSNEISKDQDTTLAKQDSLELYNHEESLISQESIELPCEGNTQLAWYDTRSSLQDICYKTQPENSFQHPHNTEYTLEFSRNSMQDLSHSVNCFQNGRHPVSHGRSMPNLQDVSSPRRPPPPPPPQLPAKSHLQSNGVADIPSCPQQMSRQTLHALSATPRSRLISNDTWQAKRKPRQENYNYQHWLIQEAEHRRITEQQQRQQNILATQPPQRISPTKPSSWGHQPMGGQAVNQPQYAIPPHHISHSHHTPLRPTAPYSTQHQWNHQQQKDSKPLPDSVIQTITQRIQNRMNNSDTNNNRRRYETHYSQNDHNQEKMLSVSGKKRCSHCGEELGRGAAMIIESLRLFYHIDCFKCCVCCIQLGDGMMGTDVRVRNNKLHCHNCYSSDDGVKFSCV